MTIGINEHNCSIVASDNLKNILKKLKSSILITTYEAKKLVIVSEYDNTLEVSLKEFARPMGMYATGETIWAGFGHSIYRFNNLNQAASKIEGDKKYDACYLPNNIHLTGEIDIHEMEYVNGTIFFVNTAFSCLCVKDEISSFTPVYIPPFISVLEPSDKCHLNGFCSRDNEPRYVTMLGISDEPMGWRPRKADGGALIDIKTNEILLDNLSMPHSPRWHNGELWFLESGKGALCKYDFQAKKLLEIATVPGFTRGLTMVEEFAFIGVSKVRESNTFGGLPVTKLAKRVCGVWIVNTTTSQTVAFLEFANGVDEIFSVSLVPHGMPAIYDYTDDMSKQHYQVHHANLNKVKMPKGPIDIAKPFFDKGYEFYVDKRYFEAIEEFQKALGVQPDYLPALLNIGISLADIGRYAEALEALNNVIEQDASIAEAYNSIGFVYYQMGNLQLARENFSKAIDVKPDYNQARASLVMLENIIEKSKTL
jgi:uncharacterized protein (TIGR03032 family)